MNPKERMLAAVQRKPVDRLPVATYNFHPLGSHADEPGYEPMLQALEQSENVGILCKTAALRTGGREVFFSTTRRQEGEDIYTITKVETPRGSLRTVRRKPGIHPEYVVEPLIKDAGDIEKYLSLPNDPATIDIRPAREISEKLGSKGLTYVKYQDPFSDLSYWFDFEDFTIKCVTEATMIEELVQREFERIQQELTQMVAQCKEQEFLFYTAGPEIATPPLFPPHVFARFVTRYQKELVKIIKDGKQFSSIHCHGRVAEVFEDFIQMGADLLEPLEPPPQGDISLSEAVQRGRGRISLMGYLQDQDLYTLSPSEIEKKVEEIRGLMGTQTGYILTTTATPFMFPPPRQFVDNYVQFIRSANE